MKHDSVKVSAGLRTQALEIINLRSDMRPCATIHKHQAKKSKGFITNSRHHVFGRNYELKWACNILNRC
jgi:hypothetical protein